MSARVRALVYGRVLDGCVCARLGAGCWYRWTRLGIKGDFGRQGSFKEQQTNWS